MSERAFPAHSGSRWESGFAPLEVPEAPLGATAPVGHGPDGGRAEGRRRGPYVLAAGVVIAAVAALVSAWLWLTAPTTALVSPGSTGASAGPVQPGYDGHRHGDDGWPGHGRDGSGR